MSERTSGKGNTDAPRVDENEVSLGQGRAERDRGTAADRGTSWLSVILGWICAVGVAFILSGIVAAIVGGLISVLGLGAPS